MGGARRRPLQNSQRVLLAKPHEGERTTGSVRGRGATGASEGSGMRSSAPRWRAATGNGAAARAERPGGQTSRPIAKPHEGGGERVRVGTGGAMRTSRPTATGPHHGTREEAQRDRTTGYARKRHGTAPWSARGTGGARARAGGGERGVFGASYQKRKVLQKKISFCIVSEKRFAFHFSTIRRFSCYG